VLFEYNLTSNFKNKNRKKMEEKTKNVVFDTNYTQELDS